MAPILTPLAQCQNHREQAFALLGQRIDHLAAVIGVRLALEYPAGDHLAQPVREDVAGNSEPRLELFEMLEAVKRAAKDQERPFLADQLDSMRQRAPERRRLERVDGLYITAQWIRTPSLIHTKAQL